MSSFSNFARHRRFQVKANSNVRLIAETSLSDQFEIKVINCSLSGISGHDQSEKKHEISLNEIIPNAKLVVDGKEFGCGRMVVRRLSDSENENSTMALSTIDMRIPIDTFLSGHLETDFEKGTNELEMKLNDERFSLSDFMLASYESSDIFNRCEKFDLYVKDFEKSDKFTYFLPRETMSNARIKVKKNRARASKELLMFGSNDYLGLSSHPEVIEAANEANRRFGIGTGGSAQTSGNTVVHEELEKRIAEMHGRDDAVVMSSGFGVNHGIIGGLAAAGDLIVADQESHVSIREGMAVSGATIRFFKHNNMDHLVKVLNRERKNHKGCLVVTEGAFSMSGDIGKINEILPIARDFEARTMVDHAHCFGILGEGFTGAAEHLGVGDEVDITMGVFSKSTGTMGAFVTGSTALVNWIKAYARPYLFSTSIPAGIAAATLKSLDIMEEGHLQEKLNNNIKRFLDGIKNMGLQTHPNHVTPIIPVEIGDENLMGKINGLLMESGIYAIPVGFPAVPKNRCRFRFSISAKHNESDIELAILALKSALDKVGFFDKDQIKRAS